MVSEEEYVRYAGRYTDMVLRIAVNYCKEYADAEDITQDVFLKLYETKTDFADEEHVKRWLIRVTVNQSKNYLASAWRRRMQPMEFQKIESVLETAGGEPQEDAEADALFEAVTSLPEKYRRAWRVVAAVAALAVAIPSVVYAATHYWGVGDFFVMTGNTLTKEADNLIERNIDVRTQDKKDVREMPVDFEVKEALCDSGSVSIVLQATAKEKGKYFLVGAGMMESEPVANVGIDEDKTIGEYAASKGLDLLYINHGFADYGLFSSSSYTSDCVSVNDDTLELYLNVRRENDSKDIEVAVKCSVIGGGNSVSSILNFKLQDKSSSEKVLYAAEGKMAVKGTKAVVTKVTMEKTEVHTYVKVYYSYPNRGEDDGLGFRILDEKGKEWELFDGKGKYLGDGKYCCDLVYDQMELPEKCILEAYDCWEMDVDKQYFGQFVISKVK